MGGISGRKKKWRGRGRGYVSKRQLLENRKSHFSHVIQGQEAHPSLRMKVCVLLEITSSIFKQGDGFVLAEVGIFEQRTEAVIVTSEVTALSSLDL